MSATGENIQETDTTIEGGGIVEWVESSTTSIWPRVVVNIMISNFLLLEGFISIYRVKDYIACSDSYLLFLCLW